MSFCITGSSHYYCYPFDHYLCTHWYLMWPACLLASWTHHYEVIVPHRTMTDIKFRILYGFIHLFWLRGPKTHERVYYYLCKHVILLSNEPYTGRVMKQLALTQTKWTAESSHVYAARWKQMLRNPNTGLTGPAFSMKKQKGPRVNVILISSLTPLQNLDFPQSNIIMWEQRLTESWPAWPWMSF